MCSMQELQSQKNSITQQVSPLHFDNSTLPAMTAKPSMPLLLLMGLSPLLWPVPSLANIEHRPANCSGRDPELFRLLLEQSASHLSEINLPVQITYQFNGFMDKVNALVNAGKETDYNVNSCLEPMETTETHLSRSVLCPWTYECDHDPARFPAYILHAHCSSEPEVEVHGTFHKCQPITYPLNVVRFVGCSPDTDMEQWELTEQIVNVGCSAI